MHEIKRITEEFNFLNYVSNLVLDSSQLYTNNKIDKLKKKIDDNDNSNDYIESQTKNIKGYIIEKYKTLIILVYYRLQLEMISKHNYKMKLDRCKYKYFKLFINIIK